MLDKLSKNQTLWTLTRKRRVMSCMLALMEGRFHKSQRDHHPLVLIPDRPHRSLEDETDAAVSPPCRLMYRSCLSGSLWRV